MISLIKMEGRGFDRLGFIWQSHFRNEQRNRLNDGSEVGRTKGD